jgi:calcineurin-like phosphoesterase family protein
MDLGNEDGVPPLQFTASAAAEQDRQRAKVGCATIPFGTHAMIPRLTLYRCLAPFRPPPGRRAPFTSPSRALTSSLILVGLACTSDKITDNRNAIKLAAAVDVTAAPVIVLAAGDIADCRSQGDEATAKLLDGQPAGTVLLLGDNAYEDGTAQEYANCYGPTWGKHKARTRPSPGNHEYHTSGASGYYGYFGAAAGPSGRGYYSFDLGEWHLVSLNSNVSMSAGSAQEKWLRADLAASTKKCTLAFWHHPRFSSSKNGNYPSTQPLWQALYDAGADLVLVGHDHSYERFAPQTPGGALDRTRGLRQFVVGTGGRKFYALNSRKPNSELFESGTWGMLKLTLGSSGYAWQFLPVTGKSFSDTGSADCVGATGGPPPTDPPPNDPPPNDPPPNNPLPGGPTIPQPPGENAPRVTLSYNSLTLGPPGASATVGARAFGADGGEWSGVPIRWWKSSTSAFALSSTECASPCSVILSTSATGSGKVIIRHYGGVARDTMPVTISSQ